MSHSKSDESQPGFTRRDLVRGALVGAVTAGVGSKVASAAESAALGPAAVPIELTVNGQKHRLSVEPRVLLASALRDRLGMTGTKVVCDRGACGACTVLVDGDASCSCLLLAAEVQGKAITTIEGLSANQELSPIQKAFIETDALQCGFCTSGMVLSCKALLDRNPRPTREQIRDGLAGNLCRCGTYPHVFEAVERAAGLKTAESAGRESGGLFVHPLTAWASGLVHDDRIEAALNDLSLLEEA